MVNIRDLWVWSNRFKFKSSWRDFSSNRTTLSTFVMFSINSSNKWMECKATTINSFRVNHSWGNKIIRVLDTLLLSQSSSSSSAIILVILVIEHQVSPPLTRHQQESSHERSEKPPVIPPNSSPSNHSVGSPQSNQQHQPIPLTFPVSHQEALLENQVLDSNVVNNNNVNGSPSSSNHTNNSQVTWMTQVTAQQSSCQQQRLTHDQLRDALQMVVSPGDATRGRLLWRGSSLSLSIWRRVLLHSQLHLFLRIVVDLKVITHSPDLTDPVWFPSCFWNFGRAVSSFDKVSFLFRFHGIASMLSLCLTFRVSSQSWPQPK
jgi:hypothetical protein